MRAAATRRLEERRAAAELGQLLASLEGDYAEADPSEVLVEQVQRCAAMAAVLGLIVGRLGEGDLYGPDHLDDARPHVATEMYRQWTAQAAKLAKLALDAGVDERRVRLAERQGEALAGVLRTILTDVGALLELDLLARADVLAVVRRSLVAVDVESRVV